MTRTLNLKLDRAAKTSLVDQITSGISSAIERGVLLPGARLPSWQDLATQLGVARGTVKNAYESLADSQHVVMRRPGGTWVSVRPAKVHGPEPSPSAWQAPLLYRDFTSGTYIFQNGVPASDCFPGKLFSRLCTQASRAEIAAPINYPDPRGEAELREAIAAHLALARGITCRAEQIFITAGFSGALGVALRVLSLRRRKAWIENPGFAPSRRALEIADLETIPIPVDDEGMNIAYALTHAPDASMALVTPGQQAPIGVPLSQKRRQQLIEWASSTGSWIIEDDYLGELQLRRRALPALASFDRTGRVIHIGSFSKTISPMLRLGFVVAPVSLVSLFAEAVLCLAPAPGPALQLATARFMRDGHYMRHLRRMKRIYLFRSQALLAELKSMGHPAVPAGLSVIIWLPEGTRDRDIARDALEAKLAPSPLSAWFDPGTGPRPGLLLGISHATADKAPTATRKLDELIKRHS